MTVIFLGPDSFVSSVYPEPLFMQSLSVLGRYVTLPRVLGALVGRFCTKIRF